MLGQKRYWRAALVGLLILGASACGSGAKDAPDDNESGHVPVGTGRKPQGGGQPSSEDSRPANPDRAIRRGRWQFAMRANSNGSSLQLVTAAADPDGKDSHTQPISATVAEAVTFTVDDSRFRSGTPSDGIVSFGSLDVTHLRDNALRVCSGGANRCTKAKIRVYTIGAAGAGLWSAKEGYGLPILAGSSTVGLGATNAAVVAELTLPLDMRVLKLDNFTGGGALEVPIRVDFSAAAAASYSSTLVVEYVVE